MQRNPCDPDFLVVTDKRIGVVYYLASCDAEGLRFDVCTWLEAQIESKWFERTPRLILEEAAKDEAVWNRALPLASSMLQFFETGEEAYRLRALELHALQVELELVGTQVPSGTLPALERTAILPCRALLDTGALGDFISSTAVDQLKLKRIPMKDPLDLQLAVQGSSTSST